LEDDPELSLFLELLGEGEQDLLNSTNYNLTVFAQNNDAIDATAEEIGWTNGTDMVAALNDAGAASNVARYHILSEAYTFNELIGSTETILFSPGVEVLFAGSGVIHDPRPLTTDASVSDDSAVTADNGNFVSNRSPAGSW